jgi:glucan phosphoethanolaminetransferase (alkaline phosphatase superfamily)
MKLSKNAKRFLIIVGILFVVFNVISFAAPFVKTAVFWVSYIFGIIAVLVKIPVMKIAFTDTEDARSKFYGFPIARIGVIYSIIQLILSLIFMGVAVFVPVWIPIILFIIVLGISSVGFIAADATRDEIVRQDEVIVKDVSFMRNIQSKMNVLTAQCQDEEIKKVVSDLAEEVRYSDPVSSDAIKDIENELNNSVEELQRAIVDNDENALEICKRTKDILLERNRLCKLNKNN